MRDKIDEITKKFKSKDALDTPSNSDTDEDEEERDWLNHYLKDYKFVITQIGEELATMRAQSSSYQKKYQKIIKARNEEFKYLKEPKELLEELFSLR